jgi:hypothetical protein
MSDSEAYFRHMLVEKVLGPGEILNAGTNIE